MEEVAQTHNQNVAPCITDSDAFRRICLEPWVLQVAWLGFRQHYGRKAFEGNINEKHRHVAYRQFVRWCWGYCGPKNRKILPSCVVSAIRAQFPNGDNMYKGFRLPKFE
ncbi:P2X purinoceptor 7-like [Tubulanus polymorphus]